MTGINQISLPWQAIHSSNVLYPSMSQHNQNEHVCSFQPQSSIIMRTHEIKNGIVTRNAKSLLCDEIEVGNWKYCKNFKNVTNAVDAPIREGTVVILNELHGNSNIGHASRDAMFLANVVMNHGKNITRIIVDDPLPHQKSAFAHRHDSLRAITLGRLDPSLIQFGHKTEPPWVSRNTIQKAFSWPGDQETAKFYRSQAYAYCHVEHDCNADTKYVMIEDHGGRVRQWNQKLEVDNLVKSQSWAKNLTLIHHSFDNTTFCEQVRIMSETAVMIAPHGAAIAGNCIFMRDRSVIVELGYMYTDWSQTSTYDPIGAASANIEMSKIIGRSYVGSMSINTYDFMTKESFDVDLNRFNRALDCVGSLLNRVIVCHHEESPKVCMPQKIVDPYHQSSFLLFIWAQIASWLCLLIMFGNATGLSLIRIVNAIRNAKDNVCASKAAPAWTSTVQRKEMTRLPE